jgi:hypothetical protein
VPDVQRGRFAEQLRDLVRKRVDVAACFEPTDELGRRGHADVGLQQRFFEPLPGEVVAGIERRDLDLLGQRAPGFRQRVAQASENTGALCFRLRRGIRLAQQFSPATQR